MNALTRASCDATGHALTFAVSSTVSSSHRAVFACLSNSKLPPSGTFDAHGKTWISYSQLVFRVAGQRIMDAEIIHENHREINIPGLVV